MIVALAACHEAPPPVAPKTANDVTPVMADGGGTVVAVSPAPAVAAPAAVAPVQAKPAKVRVTIRSLPPKALVTWGKKKLGPTPVILERPRGSGPMDLIVKLVGYFPVHTRAYTFKNDVLYVKLTKLQDRMTIFGARA